MSVTRVTTRLSRTLLVQCRNMPVFIGCLDRAGASSFNNRLNSHTEFRNQLSTVQASLLHHSAHSSSAFQWFGFSSNAPSSQSKETALPGDEEDDVKVENDNSAINDSEMGQGSATEPPSHTCGTTKRRKSGTKRVAFSDSESDSESHPSRDDLLKRVAKKEQLLHAKQEELEQMKDKVLRNYAEMENMKERTRRESENAKKFGIQNFAKSLLDVADNLGRASSAGKESFSKIDVSKDTTGAAQHLKALLEGVEMTEKQLSEVFKKFGLEKYDPVNEEFDPNKHHAVFEVPDPSKPADHVAVVLKPGYMLHNRVIRPAEVGVTVATDSS